MTRTRAKKIKIVRIEPLVWNRKDLIIKPLMGRIGYRARYNGQDLEVPFEDTIKIECRKKNKCVNNCDNYATKIIYLDTNVKGALKIERFCDKCLDLVADLGKMIMRPVDDSEILEKVTIKPSGGSSGRAIEDWKDLIPNYKKS